MPKKKGYLYPDTGLKLDPDPDSLAWIRILLMTGSVCIQGELEPDPALVQELMHLYQEFVKLDLDHQRQEPISLDICYFV